MKRFVGTYHVEINSNCEFKMSCLLKSDRKYQMKTTMTTRILFNIPKFYFFK